MLVYIPIGVQCGSVEILKKLELRKESFPFDWMLCHPKFVYDILYLLLHEDINIEHLVRNVFFKCEHRARMVAQEHHEIVDGAPILCNKECGVLFPHDAGMNLVCIEKYIRRFERLRRALTEISNFIVLLYISPSSLRSGNFTIDGKDMVEDTENTMMRLDRLLYKSRGNTKRHKIVCFVTDKSVRERDDECLYIKHIAEKNHYKDLFPEVKSRFKAELDRVLQ